jgi:hypothetical protein
MINAHTPTYAATGAPARSALVRLARQGLVACALVCAGLGAAQAQHGRGQYRDDGQVQQDGRGERFPQTPREAEGAREQRFDPRSFDTREFDDVRRRNQQMQQEQNARNAEAQRRSRMTPDERRDLRRQINEAGMDLYPSKPHH